MSSADVELALRVFPTMQGAITCFAHYARPSVQPAAHHPWTKLQPAVERILQLDPGNAFHAILLAHSKDNQVAKGWVRPPGPLLAACNAPMSFAARLHQQPSRQGGTYKARYQRVGASTGPQVLAAALLRVPEDELWEPMLLEHFCHAVLLGSQGATYEAGSFLKLLDKVPRSVLLRSNTRRSALHAVLTCVPYAGRRGQGAAARLGRPGPAGLEQVCCGPRREVALPGREPAAICQAEAGAGGREHAAAVAHRAQPAGAGGEHQVRGCPCGRKVPEMTAVGPLC